MHTEIALPIIFQGSADFAYSSKPIGIRIEKELKGEELNIRDFIRKQNINSVRHW